MFHRVFVPSVRGHAAWVCLRVCVCVWMRASFILCSLFYVSSSSVRSSRFSFYYFFSFILILLLLYSLHSNGAEFVRCIVYSSLDILLWVSHPLLFHRNVTLSHTEMCCIVNKLHNTVATAAPAVVVFAVDVVDCITCEMSRVRVSSCAFILIVRMAHTCTFLQTFHERARSITHCSLSFILSGSLAHSLCTQIA